MFSYYLFKDIVYDYLSQFEHRSVLTKFCVDDIMSHFALNFKSSLQHCLCCCIGVVSLSPSLSVAVSSLLLQLHYCGAFPVVSSLLQCCPYHCSIALAITLLWCHCCS